MSVFGSFLDECLVHCHGDYLVQDEYVWCIHLEEHNAVYPFAKMSKRIAIGREESVGTFFKIIPVIFESPSKPRS